MIAVLKHELRSYFHSFTAYVFGAFLLAIVGIGAILLYMVLATSLKKAYVRHYGELL